MKISNRLTHLTGGGDDGWEVFRRARALVASGVDVTELTIGEHDIRTDPSILAAMDQSARAGHTGYAKVIGIDSLRDAIAARVTARTGVATTRDNVLVTPGGQAALFAAHVAALEPGDHALFPDPYYATYPGAVRAAGGVPVPVPTRARDAFQPTRAALDAAHAQTPARSLMINTPNNPTGVVYDRDTLDGIAGFVTDNGLWLISDEVYDTQIWAGQHISPRARPGMVDRTMVIGSMSKSHAMTGSRIGWVIAPAPVIDHLANLATHITYGVPGFIQDAAYFALNQGDALEHKIAAPFARRRDLALALIAQQNVVRAIPSGGAMYLMLDIRATGQSGEAFALALLEQERIAVMPGESFGAAAAGHIRVALTVDDDRLGAALSRLLAFAKDRTP